MAEHETSLESAGLATGEAPLIKQTVEISDKGPCLKHIKVTIARESIDRLLEEKLEDLGRQHAIPGFRPGKAPRSLVRRHLEPQALEEIRTTLFVTSIEDVMKSHNLQPITMPNIDPLTVQIPKEGPLVYEFDLEVWPEIQVPPYKGLHLKRPVFAITEDVVRQFANEHFRIWGGRYEKKEMAEEGDTLVGTLSISRDGEKVAEFPDVRLVCEKELRFKDAIARNFLETVAGARAGETREFVIEMIPTQDTASESSTTGQAQLRIEGVYRFHPAESLEAVAEAAGLESVEGLYQLAREILQNRIEHFQMMFLREQILALWMRETRLDLPPHLLRQLHVRNLRRRVEELLQAGYSPNEINRHSEALVREALTVAVSDIVAQMIVQEIAEIENIEVTEEEIQQRVEEVAEEMGETPRRLRSRLEREGRIQDFALALLENKVLRFVQNQSDIEDFPVNDFSPTDLLTLDSQKTLLNRLFKQTFGEQLTSQLRIHMLNLEKTQPAAESANIGTTPPESPSSSEEQSPPTPTEAAG
ncbi:MAG: trigger factor [Gemmatales bacterium]|nr:trigger factor [Gemmatales bacterium]